MPVDLVPYIFGTITLVGVVYFLYSIFFGGADADASAGLELPEDAGEFGCQIVAAFLAGFGAVGLGGTLSGWGLPLTLAVAAVFGVLIGYGVMSVLKYVARQQHTVITRDADLIGLSARMTIETPEGKTGESIVDGAYVAKYPTREAGGGALSRGDMVEIVDVKDGTLYVKKKRRESD